MIDMHLHSKWSDGEKTIAELVERIADSKISYAALTDHDCIKGNEEFRKACHNHNIISTLGTELEAYYDIENSKYLHMLCYNYTDTKLLDAFLESERALRIQAIKKAIRLLNMEGLNIRFEDVVSMSEGRHLLINHLCILLEKIHVVASRYEAYQILLKENAMWNLNYPKPSVEEIIKLIYDVGGIPVLAHPKRIQMRDLEKEQYVGYLKSLGLMGIESYYAFDNEKDRQLSEYLAKKYDLIETVGSDWHCEADHIEFSNPYISSQKEKILRRVFFHE